MGHLFPVPIVTRELNFKKFLIGIVEGASAAEEGKFTVLLTQIPYSPFSFRCLKYFHFSLVYHLVLKASLTRFLPHFPLDSIPRPTFTALGKRPAHTMAWEETQRK